MTTQHRRQVGGRVLSTSLRSLTDNPAPRVRLLCFPYAGAGGYVYRRWVSKLPTSVEICAVQPPGREDRASEALPAEMDQLIGQMVDELRGILDGPYAVFGHSLGALIGAEVVRRLTEEGAATPARLFVSGSRALPDIHHGRRRVHLLSDDELVQHLRALNGTPAALLDDERMLTFVLRLVRSDSAILDTYRYRPGRELSCPITVFGGEADPLTDGYDLTRWAEMSSARTEVIMLPGDHFFLHSAEAQMLSLIGDRLKPVAQHQLRHRRD